jgi:hypothetical protein
MAKKIKRFNAGGSSEYEGDDPIVKYRLGIKDKEKEPEFETKTGENEAISKDPGIRERAMKFLEKSDEKSDEVKKEVKPKAVTTARKVVAKTDTKASMNDMPESLRAPDYKAPSVVKSVSKDVTKPTKRFDPAAAVGVRRLNPAPEFMTRPIGLKSGGGVKSASSRADGCAIRGKTRA